MKILMVEDAPRLRDTLAKALTRLGHAVDTATNAAEGDALARSNPYDVAILDRMLPDADGLSLLSQWRQDQLTLPVLILTALADVDEKVRGLHAGADDYLTKPFALAELNARIEALGRRRYAQPNPILTVGPLTIDTAAKSVRLHHQPIPLTPREFALLECLARRPGQVLNRTQIEERIYPELASPASNAVDSAICALRRKLSSPSTAPFIHTRRGLGYVLEP